MVDEWLEAAAKYGARLGKTPDDSIKTRQWVELAEGLSIFLRSKEGMAALILLASSDSFIILARCEDEQGPIVQTFDLSGVVRTDTSTINTFYGWGPYGPSKIVIDPTGFTPPVPIPVPLVLFALKLLKHGTHTNVLEQLRNEISSIAKRALT